MFLKTYIPAKTKTKSLGIKQNVKKIIYYTENFLNS